MQNLRIFWDTDKRSFSEFTFFALSVENEKYFFFSLRLKRAYERAVIFIFLLLLPISITAQANDTSLPFRTIAIESQFYDVLIQHPGFMKEGGARLFDLNDSSCLLIGIARTFLDNRLPQTILRAKREGEILARTEILSFSGDIQISTSRVAKTGSLQTEKTNGTISLSSFLQITETKVEGIIRQLPIVGTWWSEDNKTLYVAVGKIVGQEGQQKKLNPAPSSGKSGETLRDFFISLVNTSPVLRSHGGVRGFQLDDGRKALVAVGSTQLKGSISNARRIAKIKAMRSVLGHTKGIELSSVEYLADGEVLAIKESGVEHEMLSKFISVEKEKVSGIIKALPVVATWEDTRAGLYYVAIGKLF